MVNTNAANAICVLNEMQQARSIYDFFFEVRQTGKKHHPTFKVLVVVSLQPGIAIKAYASAGNKKLAKTLAAAKALEKMAIPVDVEETSSEYSEEESPVARLNSYYQQHKTGTPPKYAFEKTGPNNSPRFKAIAFFLGRVEVGYGGTKRCAKEEAARKLASFFGI